MVHILHLPGELWLEIGDCLQDDLPSLRSLASTNRRLNQLLDPVLYKAGIRRFIDESTSSVHRHHLPSSLVFAAWNDNTTILKKTAKAMEFFSAHSVVNINHLGPVGDRYGLCGDSTVLHIASYRGSNKVVRALLAMGADVNQLSEGICYHVQSYQLQSYCWRPLHFALCQGHSETAKILMEGGANYAMNADHSPNSDGFGPTGAIHFARPSNTHSQEDIVQLIYQKTCSGQGDWGAERQGSCLALLNRMTKHGAPIHFAIRASEQHGTGQLSDLIRRGVDINIWHRDIDPPLVFAVERGLWPAANILLSHGAKLTYPDAEGHQDHVILKALCCMLYVGPTNSSNSYQSFPTDMQPRQHHFATGPTWREAQQDFISKALSAAGDDFHFDTLLPLHYLAKWVIHRAFQWEDRFEVTKFLVEKCGVDLNAQDKKGNTVLHILTLGFDNRLAKMDSHYANMADYIAWILEKVGPSCLQAANRAGQTPVTNMLREPAPQNPRRTVLTTMGIDSESSNHRGRLAVIDIFLRYKEHLAPASVTRLTECRTETLRILKERGVGTSLSG